MKALRGAAALALACASLAAGTALAAEPASAQAGARRPNILLVVADDLGYSDLGAFGGEIATPNLDRLAATGVRLTGFHASPFCSPTRAMLMSGVDNHLVGFGAMGELVQPLQAGRPGYEGYLNNRALPFPELLQAAGYHTYMAGKWHLGTSEETSPANRGFEQSYAMVMGGASHFDQTGIITMDANKDPVVIYRDNGKPVNLAPGFFSSEAYASKVIQYIDHDRGDGKPFFAYLAFTAPHWPLQAPDEYIRKYEGKYDVGYDVIRERRLARMKALGIIPKDSTFYAGNPVWPKWNQLTPEQKRQESKRMAVYAAMVEAMDHHLGRVIDHLKQIGEYDNTFIFFMSDNGADGNSVLDEGQDRPWNRLHRNNKVENIGKADSFAEYGPGWAQVSSLPFKMYKAFEYEGGISVPAIAVAPKLAKPGSIRPQFGHVTDIAPTLLELAGASYPGANAKGRDVVPLQGRSMLAFLSGDAPRIHGPDQVTGWELGGRKAIRKGDWKLVYASWPWGSGQWELYDLASDRTEQHDLAGQRPEKVEELLAAYQAYVKQNGVVDAPGLSSRPGYSNALNYYDDISAEEARYPLTYYEPTAPAAPAQAAAAR
ncbi:MAG: arylsulfatase [Proteobacteria bacterium]|nr:arylsulfatase [Pseudomonadota bacterium]